MTALVVYESMFGNTRAIALALAEGLGRVMPVQAVEVADAPVVLPTEVTLLVVGGPTHAHGMTKPESRADAAKRAGDRLVSRGSGVREWLARLQPAVGATAGAATAGAATAVGGAAFDTRIKGPELLWGSAAKGIAERLRTLGFRVAAEPESFLVGGPTGPLFDRLGSGELERAREWGEALALASTPTSAASR